MSEQPGGYQRSASGLVGAMLVLVVLVVAFVVVRNLVREEPPSPVQTVDYTEVLASARDRASYPVLAPDPVPEGWRATQVAFSPVPSEHWHLAFLTDTGRYVGLEQALGPARPLLEQYVDLAPQRGKSLDVAGEKWATWHDQGGDLALSRTVGGVSTVLVGHDVPTQTLVDFLGRLN